MQLVPGQELQMFPHQNSYDQVSALQQAQDQNLKQVSESILLGV